MHHTCNKEIEKKILKNEVTKTALRARGFEPGPSKLVRTKSWLLDPLNHLGKNVDDYSLTVRNIPKFKDSCDVMELLFSRKTITALFLKFTKSEKIY